jgi:serine phosphatase RsbU (regulator of sigma subunit)
MQSNLHQFFTYWQRDHDDIVFRAWSRIMHGIPKLSDIAQSVPEVDAFAPISEIVIQFNEKPELVALPVTENGATIGIVRKGRLFQILSRAFALEVYSRRPIGSLLDAHSVQMDPDMDIHSALGALLKADPSLETDAILLISQNVCRGIVPVSTLLINISENQSRLLSTLESLTERIRHEVQKAAQIQQALLPASSFHFPGVRIAAGLKTCTEIGGDFFDYFAIDSKRLCLVIADVSGHGVQAGMVTTAAKASLHSLATNGITTPSLLLSNMNEAIRATANQTLLMTCFIAVIRPEERVMHYANAGHNFPFLCRKGPRTVEMLPSPPGFPLGFDENAVLGEQTVALDPGDCVVLYSDGINECSNGVEDFGYGRFKDCLQQLEEQPLEEWVRYVMTSLAHFRGHEPYDDDITLVAVRFEDRGMQYAGKAAAPALTAPVEKYS